MNTHGRVSFLLLVSTWCLSPFVSCLGAWDGDYRIGARMYPREQWETRTPAELVLDAQKLDAIAAVLQGRGCIVRGGYVVKTWGDQSKRGDWLSSSKPLLSTLLFFAIQEGRVDDVDSRIASFGWDLNAKDEMMTFHHLANMISGYARPDAPGAAWAYNDYAINLYRLTLFDRVFRKKPEEIVNDPQRLGSLQFQDGLSFNDRGRLIASVRDFARICWFWVNRGRWQREQLLSEEFFEKYCRPQVPRALPHTAEAKTDDYLKIGTYGGGSDHFTRYGPGIYGYNFWFNGNGRDHRNALTWPDAPRDAFMTVGAGGNSAVIIPSLDMMIVAAKAKWGSPRPGDASSAMNQVMKLASQAASRPYTMTGDFRKWHTVTIDFRGPRATTMATEPNPFLDYRLDVLFTSPEGRTYRVPGFFDGDGFGGDRGTVWRVRFTPYEAGEWSFRASFRKGPGVAVSLNPEEGGPAAFDGCEGDFRVEECEEHTPQVLKRGRLEYAGGHYLKFREGPYWIKGGTDSPEDLLAYEGFANTRSGSRFKVKTYTEHVRDWRPGDPDWGQGKGKGIIGAINYLASQNVNLIYFLPMNIGGDGKNVWPYAGDIDPKGSESNDNTHFDIEKLHQWEIVFEHAQSKGLVLHFVFNEAEKPNKLELGADLTTDRKLFYREMVARFAHHNAILWNLCEEYNIVLDLGPENVKAFARYLKEVDPYDHPITVHHAGNAVKAWEPFLGNELFSLTSLQIGNKDIEPVVETFRELSEKAGRPLPVAIDEFTVTTHGKAWLPEDDFNTLRIEKLWPAYLSGGQVEFILGDLLDTEDFRKHEDLWRYIWHARSFLEENLPFWEMVPADMLLDGESVFKGKTSTHDGQVFAKPGHCYALYFPAARETGTLDLSATAGKFVQRWYNPRTGKFVGPQGTVMGGGRIDIGPPPEDPEEDWALLLTKEEAQETVNIIPLPVSILRREGSFRITPATRMVAGDGAAGEAKKLVDAMAPAMGCRLRLVEAPSASAGTIQMRIDSSLMDRLDKEGYELQVTTRSVVIRAAAPAGLFYGGQTLRQLLPPAALGREKTNGVAWIVPCVRITDYPRFAWRGLLIDPARHFIPVPDVERFIDAMALHKLNRLQVHFTDDQGWRIEIKKYPELVRTGAWMDFTAFRRDGTDDSRPGGFYTQEDIRHLVRYATERYITIVPEIEMPAHTGAAIVSYPYIGLYPERLYALRPEKRWTANERVLAPRPQTAAFMQDVLTEVMDLFPSRYIHIGGDEANIDHWRKSEEMQSLIPKLGLKSVEGLHSWFIRQMDEFLTRHDRQLVGWDEILQGGLAPGAVVMSWRGVAGGITAARAGHDVVMAPTSHTYFDYYQGPKEAEPRAIGGFIPLEKVYQYEPIPEELNAQQARHVLGGQGQLWGEYIPNRKHREYMTYPRAAALSETLWSPQKSRDYGSFLLRLREHLDRLEAMKVNYRPVDGQ